MKRLVFVTGAGRGIGRSIALKLIQDGYVVSGCARSLPELEEARRLSEGRLRIAQVDVRDAEKLATWMKTEINATKAEATPWGLVTAAGIYGPIGTFLENSWDAWREGLEVNLYGTCLTVKCFLDQTLPLKAGGRIVLLSGGGATQPMANFSSYCASKAAVVRWGETLALELEPHGVTVNSLAPGAVVTALTREVLKAGPDKAGRTMYEKTLKQVEEGGAQPDKAAALASYLLGEHGKAINGKLISAVWDEWQTFHENAKVTSNKDIYTLRRQTT